MPGTRPGMTKIKILRQELNRSQDASVAETSARYDGWRIVAVCFLVATFGWGFGFYGQSCLSRRVASPAWLAGLADLVRDDLLLSVRRGARRFRQRGGAGVRPAQLPARRYICDGRCRRHDGPGHRAVAAFTPPMRCWHSAGPAPVSASSPIRSACGSTKNAAWRSASR